MASGRAHGINRDYQVLARDILVRIHSTPLEPYDGDGIDVPITLGSATRTFDVALKDPGGRIVVAECKRTGNRVKLADFDAFAYRVEFLRNETGAEVAGVYFAKTGYQGGPVKAAKDAGIRVAVCAQDQPRRTFALVFERYDADRERRPRDGCVLIESSVAPTGSLRLLVIRADGTREDRGTV